MIWLGVLLVVILLFVASFQYLAWYQRWENRNTVGMAYYGKSLAERRALKAADSPVFLARHAVCKTIGHGHSKAGRHTGI